MARLKLTRAKLALLEKHMKLGAPMADVFAASGVPSSTYHRWMSIGQALAEEDLEHPAIPGPPERRPSESLRKYNGRLRRHEEKLKLYVTLYEKMQKANADTSIEMVAVIRSAALNGDWRTALKFLERRDPHNWNRKQILRNLTTRETHHQHQDSVMAPDMLDLLRLLKHSERSLSKGLEDDCNGADSQPKAE